MASSRRRRWRCSKRSSGFSTTIVAGSASRATRRSRQQPIAPARPSPRRSGAGERGVLSWVHRIKRVREPCPDLLGDDGWRWRVLADVEQLRFRRPFAGRRPAKFF